MINKTATFSTVFAAAALALAGQSARAADMKTTDMKTTDMKAADMKAADMKSTGEKCYGVARAAKNDCAAGVHSCAGQATRDFDKASFVLLPAGVCAKLAGGSTMAMAK